MQRVHITMTTTYKTKATADEWGWGKRNQQKGNMGEKGHTYFSLQNHILSNEITLLHFLPLVMYLSFLYLRTYLNFWVLQPFKNCTGWFRDLERDNCNNN